MNPRPTHVAIAIVLLALISPGQAQVVANPAVAAAAKKTPTEPSGDQPVVLAEFTVTGSNIKRIDSSGALPVTTITAEEIGIRDAAQPADLMLSMPQVMSLPNNETSTLNNTARGDNASVSLRGIPSGNTLVLLNGRRLVPHAISQSESGTPALSVNINQLPNRGIQRIELLTDGSSAIYGTDAVAGVVNYIMKQNYRGTEISTRFGQTNYGDGREYRATVTHGADFAHGKGTFMFTLDYYHRDLIAVPDRPFAADADNSARAPAPWNVTTDTTFNFRSASSAYGNFNTGTLNANGSFTAARPAGVSSTLVSSAGLFFLVPTADGGVGIQTTTPSRTGVTHDYYWNSNQYRVIQPRTDRINFFTTGEYRLNDHVTLFSDLSVYQSKSKTVREMDFVNSSVDGTIVVPASNPYNPFGDRFFSVTGAPNADGTPRLTGTPSAVRINNKRFIDLEPRAAIIDTQSLRGVFGARGKLSGSWTWESAGLISEGHVTDTEHGSTRRSLLQAAINQTDPAKAFNPFTETFAVQNGTIAVTGPYTNPESVISTFRSDWQREGKTKLASLDGKATGDIVTIWGGNTIAAALGGEYRYEGYGDTRPPFVGLNPADSGLDPTSADFLSYVGSADTHGRRDVASAFGEVQAPLIGNRFRLPLVYSLSIDAAARFEHYTDFGNTTKPKIGANWRPIKWLLVRASFNEGFRAPNLAQLFNGELRTTLVSSTDTYRSPVTSLPQDGATNRIQIASGNRQLTPETSKGKSAGIVVEVPHVKGLSFAADYWEIDRRDLIATGGGIGDDNAALQAETQRQLATGVAINSIDLGSGTDHYLGDSSVVRLPVTQVDRDFFAAYNAIRVPGNQRAVVGSIDHVNATYFNRSKDFVSGVDLTASYRSRKFALGRFTLDSNWSYIIDAHSYTTATSARLENKYWNPIWKGSTTFNWRRDNLSIGLGWFRQGSYTDGATTSLTTWTSLGNPSYIRPVFTNGSYQYRHVVSATNMYNANVAYTFDKSLRYLGDTTVRLGAVNITNEEPPLTNDSRGYDVGRYNTMARGVTWSLEITKRL